MVYEKAAAFGLSSIVYVPKIELDTVTELSAFCEKASMVSRTTSKILNANTVIFKLANLCWFPD